MDNQNQMSKIVAVVDPEKTPLTSEQLEAGLETYLLGGVHLEAVRLGEKIVFVNRRRTGVVH